MTHRSRVQLGALLIPQTAAESLGKALLVPTDRMPTSSADAAIYRF